MVQKKIAQSVVHHSLAIVGNSVTRFTANNSEINW